MKLKSSAMKKLKLVVFAFGLMIFYNTQGQTVGPSTLNAAGGSGTIGSNVYEFSIAEMTLVNTLSNANIIVTQGVLQPNQNGIGIKDFESVVGSINVYPNPTQNVIHIDVKPMVDLELDYVLVDISGKTLFAASLPKNSSTETQTIDLQYLPAGTYTLMVSAKNTDLRTSFKIEKVK